MGAPAAQARADQLSPRRTRGLQQLSKQHGRPVLKRLAPSSAAILAIAAFALSGCGGGSSTATGENPDDGERIFAESGCAGCHAFAPAGSGGGSGPDLNNIKLDAAAVADQVKNGGGGMPSFGGSLTDAQITAVSEFVAAGDGSAK